jgi:hypothetical protein
MSSMTPFSPTATPQTASSSPRCRTRVQRFATPWYRLRTLHLFRDQTALSASSGLWTAIEAALSRAAWFVLFASPDAAASIWVEREVSWWLAHRDHRQLLIVVTDGTFEWDAGDGGPGRARGSAVPDALDPSGPRQRREIVVPGSTVFDFEFFPDGRWSPPATTWGIK